MPSTINNILHRIADPFIFGSIIISLCTMLMVLETYLLLGVAIQVDGLSSLVFFATLFLYNFHRLMGVRRIKDKDLGLITRWASHNIFTLLMLTIIGAGGVGIFVFQVPLRILFILFPLGAVSMLYELPLVRYNKRFNQIRNLWIFKIFLITGVWSLTTTLLPAVNAGIALKDYNLWLVIIERTIFIFILALCFDVRDISFDSKDGLKTIPVQYGIEKSRQLYKICAIAFFVITALHYLLLRHFWGVQIAMTASIIITYFIIVPTYPRKTDYYYLFFVDGMMILQFLLTALLYWLK